MMPNSVSSCTGSESEDSLGASDDLDTRGACRIRQRSLGLGAQIDHQRRTCDHRNREDVNRLHRGHGPFRHLDRLAQRRLVDPKTDLVKRQRHVSKLESRKEPQKAERRPNRIHPARRGEKARSRMDAWAMTGFLPSF